MTKNGRFSPSSVAQELSERGSPPRILGDAPRTKSFDSQNNEFCSISAPEAKNGPALGVITPGKCRLLPCRTFISTGSCCYGDRCVFLHDQGVIAKPVYVKYLKKSKEDNSADAFFWPMMPVQLVKSKLDNRNQPDINQAYVIPAPYVHPTIPNLSSNMNHFAVFSMWEHFVDFLASDSLSIVANPRPVHTMNPYQRINHFTGRKRLDCFSQLSIGQSIENVEALVPEVLVNSVLTNE
jgi:hypothetical protein